MNVNGLTIDYMKEEDLLQVIEIEKASFSIPWSYNSFLQELNNVLATYYCAYIGEKVVGYAGMWVILEEAHITTLAVHPSYKKKGIGSLLIEKTLSRCRSFKASEVTLEVRESNKPAQNLYGKYGFTIIGKRKNYYLHESALVMTLVLEGVKF